jgi:hypothetical protein
MPQLGDPPVAQVGRHVLYTCRLGQRLVGNIQSGGLSAICSAASGHAPRILVLKKLARPRISIIS